MRIVSYNILDGGEGRADPLAEVILAQRADVVTLIESDNLEVVDRIARRAKMDFIHAPAAEKAVTILSRLPIRHSINHALLGDSTLTRGCVEAELEGGMVIVAVHLHARAFDADESIRESQLRELLQRLASHREENRPHLLCGDFNANAPSQIIDPAKCKPKTREAWQANGGQLPRRAVQLLLNAGYIDTLHAADPSLADRNGTFTTQSPGQRIDYIFAHGIKANAIASAWIETDRLAKYASDHYPVGAEFTL